VSTADFLASIINVLFALGFMALVRTSSAGKWPGKPWQCRTCLSGWGAIAGAFLLARFTGKRVEPWGVDPLWVLWYALTGTGGAWLVRKALIEWRYRMRAGADAADDDEPPIAP
jgi:hypothetical protein